MTATRVEKCTQSRFARANPSRGPPVFYTLLRIERAAHDVGRRDVFHATPQVNVRWQ